MTPPCLRCRWPQPILSGGGHRYGMVFRADRSQRERMKVRIYILDRAPARRDGIKTSLLFVSAADPLGTEGWVDGAGERRDFAATKLEDAILDLGARASTWRPHGQEKADFGLSAELSPDRGRSLLRKRTQRRRYHRCGMNPSSTGGGRPGPGAPGAHYNQRPAPGPKAYVLEMAPLSVGARPYAPTCVNCTMGSTHLRVFPQGGKAS